jgi:GT2 family glycosyltransferase
MSVQASAAQTSLTGVSIIIPTYESWSLLERTLAAVIYDALEVGLPCEVLAIDNESDPELMPRLHRRFAASGVLRTHRRTGLGGRHFQPGAARNEGISRARHECLVFLDSDCVPARGLIRRYVAELQANPDVVLLGHRVFVDATDLNADDVALDRTLLEQAPRVASASNYGRTQDRRLSELRALETHPRPYDCLFACNFAIHRDCLGDLRFDAAYDGHWGYEDIDLGFRLHRNGRRFRYLREAVVYHQEGGPLSAEHRRRGRLRNFPLAAARIPGFEAYRAATRREAPLPNYALLA